MIHLICNVNISSSYFYKGPKYAYHSENHYELFQIKKKVETIRSAAWVQEGYDGVHKFFFKQAYKLAEITAYREKISMYSVLSLVVPSTTNKVSKNFRSEL